MDTSSRQFYLVDRLMARSLSLVRVWRDGINVTVICGWLNRFPSNYSFVIHESLRVNLCWFSNLSKITVDRSMTKQYIQQIECENIFLPATDSIINRSTPQRHHRISFHFGVGRVARVKQPHGTPTIDRVHNAIQSISTSSWLRCNNRLSNKIPQSKRNRNQRHYRPSPHPIPRRRTRELRRIAVRSLHHRDVLLPRTSMQTSSKVLLKLPAVFCGRIVVIAPFAAAYEANLVGSTALLHYRRSCVSYLGDYAPFGGHVCVREESCDGAGAAEAGCLGWCCGHDCFYAGFWRFVFLCLVCELRIMACGVPAWKRIRTCV
jgi:hypothetical protein